MAIVLLVDPSQTIRRVVEMVFKGSGHDVVTATSATEGQQALVRYQPSVAIVNYHLPDGSGIELCRLIKANPPTSRTPVVVLGGSYAPFDPEQARAAGAVAVVMKPFRTADLLDPVMDLIAGEDETLATSQTVPASAPQPAAPAAHSATVASSSAPATVPRPHATAQAQSPPAAERPRYAPPAQPARPAPSAVPRPAPPPAPQSPPPAQPAPVRSQPAPARAAEPAASADVTHRVASPGPPAAAPPTSVAAAPVVDREMVRAMVEDLLPQIALDTLQKMLADWLEARLRNYIHELVRQELSRHQRQ